MKKKQKCTYITIFQLHTRCFKIDIERESFVGETINRQKRGREDDRESYCERGEIGKRTGVFL